MRRFYFAVLLAVTASILAGCSVAPLKKAPVEKSMRIGIVTDGFGDKLTHTHVGTTIFANFEDEYPLGFDIQKYVTDHCTHKLAELGYAAKALQLDPADLASLKEVVHYSKWDGSMSLSPEAAKITGAIGSKYGVDFVILYTASKGSVTWGQTGFPAGQYGLFSRSFLNIDQFMSYSFLHVLALRVNPTTVNADGWSYDNPVIADFPMPDDFHHLSDTTLELVRKAIERRVDAFVDATTTNALGTSAPVELKGAFLR